MTESNTRALVFFGCILGGLLLVIPAAWLGHLILDAVEWPSWMESVLGLAIALTPLGVLIRLAAVKLDAHYPDSAPGKIPEPHERPSAHR